MYVLYFKKIGELISGGQKVTYGVPQGSILGPALFLIYINEFGNLNICHDKILTFANDAARFFTDEK